MDGRLERGLDTPEALESEEVLARELARVKALTEAKRRVDFRETPWFRPYPRTRSSAAL